MSTDTPTPETDAELIEKCSTWITKLCRTGGQAWSLSVPVDSNRDPDELFSELIKRFKERITPPESAPTPEAEKPLTWDQALQEVGKVEEVDSIYRSISDGLISASICEEIFTTAAELYAEASFHRGAREQREICSGEPNDFERDLYDLIKRHINAGLKRPDLIHKLEYVTQSCRVS